MDTSKPFWMIYGRGQGAPTACHATMTDAAREARRLANSNPGIEFVILRSVAVAKKVDVEFKSFPAEDNHGDELPF